MMCKFTVKLAGVAIAVETISLQCMERCRDYLTDEEPELSVSVSAKDVEREKMYPDAEGLSNLALEWTALYRIICSALAQKNIVLIHGSCVEVDGQAYLFCAPSGTGKSTHTRFWREYLGDRAIMVNDDKPLVKAVDGKALIYGTPWNGKHKLGSNISAPLKAVCFLERGENNQISSVDKQSALPQLLKYVFRPEDPIAMMHVLDSTSKIADFSDFWNLKCNMSQDAAKVSFKAMSEA